MKSLPFILSLIIAASVFGQTALHEIQFSDQKFVSFPENRKYAIYPLSERAMPMIQANTGRNVIAADYIMGIKIKTENPEAAAQMILGQISDAIKMKLSPFWNSRLKEAKPSTVLSGIGKNSIWSIFISPSEGGDYVVTISYVIEKGIGG
ncbi:hypothetical protein OpiT1DRAFT_00778 [Opitutaceae bacterium TAV1]|nr:hypothetical protein OpiT1DRAFT_00778 [Opitutaceae bacterium TAV1]